MSIRDLKELVALREVGRIVRLALAAITERVRPGISTADLAEIGAGVMRRNGARSAPVLVYGFPEKSASASTTKPSMEFPPLRAGFAPAIW